MGTLGIEPRTVRLKVGCSTAELRALDCSQNAKCTDASGSGQVSGAILFYKKSIIRQLIQIAFFLRKPSFNPAPGY